MALEETKTNSGVARKVKGRAIMVKIFDLEEGKDLKEQLKTAQVLAGQRNVNVTRTANSLDATTKDTEGDYKESVAGTKEWNMSLDGLSIKDDESYEKLEDAFEASENVGVLIVYPTKIYYGAASISDASFEGPYEDLATYSVSLQGNGPLLRGVPADITGGE